jgi:CubicO group peptidase (beta-lactamase class C family)
MRASDGEPMSNLREILHTHVSGGLDGQGWGFGGSVDVEPIDPWNIPGRYGWVGGTGTAAHVTPSTGTVAILLSQLELAGPTSPALMQDFWRHAAST